MILHIVRALFLVVVLATTITFAVESVLLQKGPEYVTLYVLIPAGAALLAILIDMFWRRKRLQALSGLFFGVLAGLAIAYMLSLIVDMAVIVLPSPAVAPNPGSRPHPAVSPAATPEQKAEAHAKYQADLAKWEADADMYNRYASHQKTVQLVKLLLGAAAVFMCVSFVLQTKDDFRFVIPYVEFARQAKGSRPMLLDTSVIIDGRFAAVAETKIIESEVLVPRFVLAELQALADSDDKLKRNRGRRGLDVLHHLQNSDKIDLRIVDPHVSGVEAASGVDAKLVALALHLTGRIVTNDYNLNKVAQLRGVDVVNLNDLAGALRPVTLPGEKMTVRITKPGEESGQGVGYLDDGTMVVVEGGRDRVGHEVALVVTRVLQTSAGRMIFGKANGEPSA